MRTLQALVSFAMIAALSGCGGGDAPEPAREVASVATSAAPPQQSHATAASGPRPLMSPTVATFGTLPDADPVQARFRFGIYYALHSPKSAPPCPECPPVQTQSVAGTVVVAPLEGVQRTLGQRATARVEWTLGDEPPQVLTAPNALIGGQGPERFAFSVPLHLRHAQAGRACEFLPFRLQVTDVAGASFVKYGALCPSEPMSSGAFSDYGDRDVTFRVSGDSSAQVLFRRFGPGGYVDEGRHFGTTTPSWNLRAAPGDALHMKVATFGGSDPLAMVLESRGTALHVAVPATSPGEMTVPCCDATIPVDATRVPHESLRTSWYTEWPFRTYVVRSAQAWQAVWDAPLKGAMNPRPPVPEVDFTRNVVIGVTEGLSGSCSAFFVREVRRRGHDFFVDYGEDAPPPLTGCPAILVPRITFVVVPAPVGNVLFVRRDRP